MSCVLACDLGSTSFRAALVDSSGRSAAVRSVAMAAEADARGWSEADPATWWRAPTDSAAALRAREPGLWKRIDAVAISAFTRSQVFVGRDGRTVRPAILWRDARAEETLAELSAAAPPGHPETIHLNAFHPLARAHWLKRAEPAAFAATAHVLEPKDWLNLRLTGVAAGDTISMARLTAAARTHGDAGSLMDAAGLDAAIIPPLRPPVSVMGQVRRGLTGALGELTGAPVIAMANDTWASVVGLGAMRPGLGYNLSGTTEVLGLVNAAKSEAEGLLAVDWSGGAGGGASWQLGGPSQSGGDTVAWLLELFARDGADPMRTGPALEALLDAPRDADPVLFLPFLQGERTPFWDPALRGAFLGLNRRHGPGDLAWAVLEGIACLNRVVLERAEAAAGRAISELRFGGGGARNLRWRQIKADILNRPVVSVPGDEHGLAGAAIAAFTALGRFPDLATAQDALVAVGERHAPRPEARDGSDRLFALFKEALSVVNPLSRKLAQRRAP
jgi:xylulokinase